MSTVDDPLVIVQNLNLFVEKHLERIQLLEDISFKIFPNEIVGVVGESGSGKSITSKALMGLLPVSLKAEAQKLELLGKDLRNLSKSEWSKTRGKVVSMIFQEPMSSLNPTKTCGEQVIEILKIHEHNSNQENKKRVLSLFEKVKLPDPQTTFKKYPHEISGGQMQRVMIAMAIACKPQILVADEPTTALDVTVQKEVIHLLKELQNEYGLSIIFISHDLALVQSIADRIIVMYKGNIEEQGTAGNVFQHPKSNYTKALIASRPKIEERLKRLPTVSNFLQNDFKALEVTDEDRKAHHDQLYKKEPILELRSVTKDYIKSKGFLTRDTYFRAVDDVSFNLFPQESLGLVGESGCGKSTLSALVLQLKTLTSGQILFNGNDLSTLSKKQQKSLRKDLQIIFQDPFASLNPRLTIKRCLLEVMNVHNIGTSTDERISKIETLLEKVGLTKGDMHKYPHQFSGGQRQRIGIARTIALEPKLIVCDESVSALDISVQAQVLNLLNDLKDLYGFSYLFISHDLSVVKYFCDRIIVMNKGKIEEINEADALYNHPKTDYTKKLIAAVPDAT